MAEEKIVTVRMADIAESIKVRCDDIDVGNELILHRNGETVAYFPGGRWAYYLVGDAQVPWQPPSE